MKAPRPYSASLTPEDAKEGWKSSDWFAGGPGDCEAWRVQFNRKVNEENLDLERLNREAWNEELGSWELTKFILIIREADPDIQIVKWRHMPISIYVRSLSLAPKIFEIIDAMSVTEAIKVAKQTWFSQFGRLGIPATILEARLATKKDFKKMQELKEVEEDEGGDVQGAEPADEAIGDSGPGGSEVSKLWLPKQS